MNKKILTLCVVHDEAHILLGLKKRGFGLGKWNGFGGKVEAGETIEEAAHRELVEEAGITPHTMLKRGILTFAFEDGSAPSLEIHVFSARTFSGEPKESDEMRPQWFSLDSIPYQNMWADDPHWLPLVLAGKNIQGTFHFKDLNTILSHKVREV